MVATFKHFALHISEEECLAEVMRLRYGGEPCSACESTAGFARGGKRRVFVCRACGLSVFPCQGTPFARDEPTLQRWFYAIHQAAGGATMRARRLQSAMGIHRPAADRLVEGIAALQSPVAARSRIDWLGSVAAFVESKLTSLPAPVAGREAPRPRTEGQETVWQTLRSVFRVPDFEGRPLLGIVLVLALALAGAGAGWLVVPSPPEENLELEQATAILTLASDKPVIIVTPEVAEQLYDVSDVDAAADSPLASSIRVAPAATRPEQEGLVESKPISQPTVKLSSNIGRQLAQGDLSGVKSKAQERPELAAYNSLARELEAGGQRNPDELLVFGPMRIRRYLVDKIVRAARTTDTDPVLLMAIADKESSFKTEVQAQTSSASGLFQFIERTWIGVVREFGSRYGLEKEARSLVAGDLPQTERQRILDMRRDPYLSAALAAEMLKRDSERIARRLGRPLTGGEIYLVHFLGPDGAERLLDQVMKKPDAVAADLLPKPAAANRPIFYGNSGDGSSKSLSVSELRSKFETMISLRLDRYRSVKSPARAPVPYSSTSTR